MNESLWDGFGLGEDEQYEVSKDKVRASNKLTYPTLTTISVTRHSHIIPSFPIFCPSNISAPVASLHASNAGFIPMRPMNPTHKG